MGELDGLMRKPTSSTQLATFLFVDSRWHEQHDAVQCHARLHAALRLGTNVATPQCPFTLSWHSHGQLYFFTCHLRLKKLLAMEN